MDENTNIVENLKIIQNRINRACIQCNRNIADVKLLMATKTVNVEKIRLAIEQGYPLIAENKIQELKEKHEALKTINHTNHFIGHLQSNKVKEILRYNVACIESLDRKSLADKLSQRLKFEGKEMNVFIQVNTSNEESKFGVAPENAIALTRYVAKYKNLHIKGLMTIGLFSDDKEKVRACFKRLKKIQQEIIAIQIPNVEMNELSMGMSGDLEIAIEEGATIVRVGTAIFGKRIYPDSYYWDEKEKV